MPAKINYLGNRYINYEGLEYEVIKDLGNNKYYQHKVIVKFIISGSEKEIFTTNIKTGKISDPMHGLKMFTWMSSNSYGEYMIIENLGNWYNGNPHQQVKLKWKDTGSITINRFDHVRDGSVKDPYKPIICGVGYYGEYNGYEEPWAYQTWKHMIERCYNTKDSHYSSYGGSGIQVDVRWHCYANFVSDIKFLLNYNLKLQFPNVYELDKDMLQQNIEKCARVYSPKTCMFIHRDLNEYLRYNNSSKKLNDNVRVKMYHLIY